MTDQPDAPASAPVDDSKEASVDASVEVPALDPAASGLLGALAVRELSWFSQLARCAQEAPTTHDRIVLARMAAAEFAQVERISERLAEHGIDVETAMAPFIAGMERFHSRTVPSDWAEGLVKVYVGGGVGSDFYRALATGVDDRTRALIEDLLDEPDATYIASTVRAAIGQDRRLAGRLALWGRRIVGEAITSTQTMGAESEALSSLMLGGGERGMDLGSLGDVFARINQRHAVRMGRLSSPHATLAV